MLRTENSEKIDLESFPSPPGVAARLLELFQRDDVETKELVETIGADTALTSKIIRCCNSPLFGRTKPIDSLSHAIVTLGLKKVRTIALSFSLVETRTDLLAVDFEKFWSHSLASAVSTQTICSQVGENPESGFLIGLVLNVGDILFQVKHPKSRKLDQVLEGTIQDVVKFEKEHFGTNRFSLTCDLLEQWNLPENIIEVIRRFANGDEYDELNNCLDLGFQFASIFLSEKPGLDDIQQLLEFNISNFASKLALHEVYEIANQEWIEYSKILEFPSPSPKSLRDLENEARNQMLSLSLSQLDEQQSMKRINETLSNQIKIDELTGLQNRRSFQLALEDEFEKTNHGIELSLLMIDVDKFKQINDTYGHLVGDKALIHIANVLARSVRRTDVLCRYGGEEFIVLMPGCNFTSAICAAERIRLMVESSIFTYGKLVIPITISIGISASDKDNQKPTSNGLIESADQSLYQAKDNGRNQCAW